VDYFQSFEDDEPSEVHVEGRSNKSQVTPEKAEDELGPLAESVKKKVLFIH
jgi:hypothetical protein